MLSHITSKNTPAYGGCSAFSTIAEKQMCCGNSCNMVSLNMLNYIGYHLDAPRYFVENGKKFQNTHNQVGCSINHC